MSHLRTATLAKALMRHVGLHVSLNIIACVASSATIRDRPFPAAGPIVGSLSSNMEINFKVKNTQTDKSAAALPCLQFLLANRKLPRGAGLCW
jgi:hypothetical protein